MNVSCFCVYFLLNNTKKKYGVKRCGDHRSHSPWQMMWSSQNLHIICIDEAAMWAVASFYCSQQYRSSFSNKVISFSLIFLVNLGCYCFLWKRIGATTVCQATAHRTLKECKGFHAKCEDFQCSICSCFGCWHSPWGETMLHRWEACSKTAIPSHLKCLNQRQYWSHFSVRVLKLIHNLNKIKF